MKSLIATPALEPAAPMEPGLNGACAEPVKPRKTREANSATVEVAASGLGNLGFRSKDVTRALDAILERVDPSSTDARSLIVAALSVLT